MNPTTLDALKTFPSQLEAHYHALPDAFTNWIPASWDGVPSEPFTAIEQICHVRDIEIDGYHVRIQRTLNEENPILESINGEDLALQRNYSALDAETILTEFRAARAKTLEMLVGLGSEQLDRRAQFDGYGALTLRSLIHYLCSHDQQHLSGLQWLLGKIEADSTRRAR